MSLDIYLNTKGEYNVKPKGSGIFVRRDGANIEISREEWNQLYPDKEPVAVLQEEVLTEEVFHVNITHNLGNMADWAGIYKHLWRPEEIGITKAHQLIEPLQEGIELLKRDPEGFKKLNPINGWGTYDQLVSTVEEYLQACINYPEATIEVSR